MFNSLINPGNQRGMTALISILFGCLGIHKFMLGYKKEGGILLGVSLASAVIPFCSILIAGPMIVGLLEGIIYLKMSDEEFFNTYVEHKKEWL